MYNYGVVRIANGLLNLARINMEDTNYFNVVLQSFLNLKIVQNYFLRKFLIDFRGDMEQIPIARECFKLLMDIYNNLKNFADPRYLFISYTQKFLSRNNYNQNLFNSKKNCYDILLNLLNYLHDELNISNNLNYNLLQYYNIPNDRKTSKDYMLSMFLDYFEQTQSSLISGTFSSTKKIRRQCNGCGIVLYEFALEKIYKIDLDYYYKNYVIDQTETLSLEKCLSYYTGGVPIDNFKCNYCQSSNGSKWEEIYCPPWVLTIYFNRNYLNGINDIIFGTKLILKEYLDKDILHELQHFEKQIPHFYELKTYICYNSQTQKFLSYCRNDDNKNWYLYIDDYKQLIYDINNELRKFQPILLFYECNIYPPATRMIDETKNYFSRLNRKVSIMDFINYQNRYVFWENHQPFPFSGQPYYNMDMNYQPNHSANNQVNNRINQINIEYLNNLVEDWFINFIVVPMYGPQIEGLNNKCILKTKRNITVKSLIQKFYQISPESINRISYFILSYNGKTLNQNSEELITKIGIYNGCEIRAVKYP